MSRFTVVDCFRLASAGLIVIAVTSLVAATAITPVGPAISRDFPDPAVLHTEDGYYAYSTASTYRNRLVHVPTWRAESPNGDWTDLGDAMPAEPAWAQRGANGTTNVTAPEVTETTGGYLLYFVAPSAATGTQCIGTALAASPTGPFGPARSPLVCQTDRVDSIDPAAFTDTDGRSYLLYASGQTNTTIWLLPVTPDGLEPAGHRRALISADRPDEHHIIEAPTLIRHGEHYVLFYSGDTFHSGGYFTDYAISRSLSEPFTKHNGQLLNRDVLGGRWPDPGGQTVLPDNQDYLFFHASTAPGVRAMFTVGLHWSPDDRPNLDLDHGVTHPYA